MLPFGIEYYRPDTIDEALKLYRRLRENNQEPVFYGGGTELLARARLQDVHFDAVIDLKNIPEVRVHGQQGDWLEFGAGLRLADLADENLWPLLTATADRIADHTTRGQITLGGNLLSTIPYREVSLPFLLMDEAEALVATEDGIENRPLANLVSDSFIKPGEFLVSVRVKGDEAKGMAYRSHKMTRQDWIDYPLVTVAVIKRPDGSMRAAFSGWAGFPFVSGEVNRILSDTGKSARRRAQEAVARMPVKALEDLHGTREYREFVTEYTLTQIIDELEDD